MYPKPRFEKLIDKETNQSEEKHSCFKYECRSSVEKHDLLSNKLYLVNQNIKHRGDICSIELLIQ